MNSKFSSRLFALALVACCSLVSLARADAPAGAAPSPWRVRPVLAGSLSLGVSHSKAASDYRLYPWEQTEGESTGSNRRRGLTTPGGSGAFSFGAGIGEHLALAAFVRITVVGAWDQSVRKSGVQPIYQVGPQLTLSQHAHEGWYVQLRGGYARAHMSGYQVGSSLGYAFRCGRALSLAVAGEFDFISTKDLEEGDNGAYHDSARFFVPGLALRIQSAL